VSAWPPLWFRVLEACWLLFFPGAFAAGAVYSFATGNEPAGVFCCGWALLMLLMLPMLMGNDMKQIRETLERYRAPRCVVWLYCETRFMSLLAVAFWVVLIASVKGSPKP
jgi:hypothetical protein